MTTLPRSAIVVSDIDQLLLDTQSKPAPVHEILNCKPPDIPPPYSTLPAPASSSSTQVHDSQSPDCDSLFFFSSADGNPAPDLGLLSPPASLQIVMHEPKANAATAAPAIEPQQAVLPTQQISVAIQQRPNTIARDSCTSTNNDHIITVAISRNPAAGSDDSLPNQMPADALTPAKKSGDAAFRGVRHSRTLSAKIKVVLAEDGSQSVNGVTVDTGHASPATSSLAETSNGDQQFVVTISLTTTVAPPTPHPPSVNDDSDFQLETTPDMQELEHDEPLSNLKSKIELPAAHTGHRRMRSNTATGLISGSELLEFQKLAHMSARHKETPEEYLTKLETTVNKRELARLVSKNDDFHAQVLLCLVQRYNFKDMAVDAALRKLLYTFLLPPEAQQIDRILKAFAAKYNEDNPGLFNCADDVHITAFAIVLLNSDLHSVGQRTKMTKHQFVSNTRSAGAYNALPAEVLEMIYENIRAEPIQYMSEDAPDVDSSAQIKSLPFKTLSTDPLSQAEPCDSIIHISFEYPAQPTPALFVDDASSPTNSPKPIRYSTALHSYRLPVSLSDDGIALASHSPPSSTASSPAMNKRAGSSLHTRSVTSTPPAVSPNPTFRRKRASSVTSSIESEPQLGISLSRKSRDGLLRRKIDLKEHGDRAVARGWTSFWAVLSGAQLLLFKDYEWFASRRADTTLFVNETPRNMPKPTYIISSESCIALFDPSYSRRSHCFRVSCPNGAQFILQGTSHDDAKQWVECFNHAACFKTAGVRPRGFGAGWSRLIGQLGSEDRVRSVSDNEWATGEGRAAVIKSKIIEFLNSLTGLEKQISNELLVIDHLRLIKPVNKQGLKMLSESLHAHLSTLKKAKINAERFKCYCHFLDADLKAPA
ncbi:hypothetical protein SeMB42_g03125 [Synchytrium endobioticum]|uniref:SEC7 domain-containing protein n=1 Tax=Synchytrium endobioticum TaxID=286115 RepID=A0A507D921_9FUNG|nr:hypothetical protein SeLEV6574_g04164 [Synchytrium endobioticum]TPX48129.1 hypothetical protein SeMB42_g03125 [Synchytrium endobioticum]